MIDDDAFGAGVAGVDGAGGEERLAGLTGPHLDGEGVAREHGSSEPGLDVMETGRIAATDGNHLSPEREWLGI